MEAAKAQKYTYSDYLTWDDGQRRELIDGVIHMMSPAPSIAHQEISGELFAQLHRYLKGKTCKVYAAPFDVRLNPDTDDDTVVQPDISIVCDPEKTKDRKNNKGIVQIYNHTDIVPVHVLDDCQIHLADVFA